jgi:hypothetical protein
MSQLRPLPHGVLDELISGAVRMKKKRSIGATASAGPND